MAASPGSCLDARKDVEGRTMLHNAASTEGAVAVLSALLAAGCDIEARDSKGASALMLAAEAGSAANLECLLKSGADVLAVDDAGQTALHYAAANGGLECAQLLLAAAPNLHAPATTGLTIGICRWSHGTTPLHLAMSTGRIGIIKLLLAAGADTNVKTQFNATPLRSGAINGHLAAVQLMLEAGAEVDEEWTPAHGVPETTLAATFRRQNADIARLLVCHGADISKVPGLETSNAKLLANMLQEDVCELAQLRGMMPALQDMIVKMACERRCLLWIRTDCAATAAAQRAVGPGAGASGVVLDGRVEELQMEQGVRAAGSKRPRLAHKGV